MNSAAQSKTEIEVSNALTAYKIALINTNYRNWWHRLGCWLGVKNAMEFESALVKTETIVRAVTNRSDEHRRHVRVISSRQSANVRQRDRFLSLIQN